ncbi:MAG: UDP-N-acetylmuramate--L-alanine ligase, partial [Mariprofundaceae bacterium]|nr:UDP-N-acetylmuramate--L-alanine ligase [Mariprofundaceae bacterium]
IYAASEQPIEGVSSDVMAAGMQQRGHRNVRCCVDLDEARAIAMQALKDGRVVLMMGAGSIGGLAASLRSEIQEVRR